MSTNRKEYMRAYQLAWIKKRREKWLLENGPCKHCGSWEKLEVDHIDESTKITHNVWSRNKEFRETELAKCQVLCKSCHTEKTVAYNVKMNTGKPILSLRKITDDEIKTVLDLHEKGVPYRIACKQVGISYSTFSSMKSRKYRKDIFSRVADK